MGLLDDLLGKAAPWAGAGAAGAAYKNIYDKW